MQKIKIETETDSYIHFDLNKNCYTLCGLETMGDSGLNIKLGRVVKGKVTCPDCIEIVKLCHLITKNDFVNN